MTFVATRIQARNTLDLRINILAQTNHLLLTLGQHPLQVEQMRVGPGTAAIFRCVSAGAKTSSPA